MKTCIRCGEVKPYSEYYVHKQMSDGYLGRCKDCHKSEMRRNRAENADYYRAYDAYRFKEQPQVRERHKRYQATEAGIESIRKSTAKFIQENPEKRLAHRMVQNAVRSGVLKKPTECPVCGEFKPSRQIHAHHHDYAKPLDIEWMCAQCHTNLHRGVSNQN